MAFPGLAVTHQTARHPLDFIDIVHGRTGILAGEVNAALE
jgi:hypothetical protein